MLSTYKVMAMLTSAFMFLFFCSRIPNWLLGRRKMRLNCDQLCAPSMEFCFWRERDSTAVADFGPFDVS